MFDLATPSSFDRQYHDHNLHDIRDLKGQGARSKGMMPFQAACKMQTVDLASYTPQAD